MPPAFDSARPLAFMHVPKTAGTSLIASLFEAIRPNRYASGFDRVLFGDFQDFASFSPSTRDVIHLSPAALPPADLITGHIALSTLRARYPDAQVMTLLREPQSRLLSHWLFWRGHDDRRLEDWGGWADRVRLARLPLADFLQARTLACQNDNVLIRMVLWPHPLIPAGDFIDTRHDRTLVEQAQARLAALDFVGVVEDAGMPSRLATWLGRPVAQQRRNETCNLPGSLQGRLDAELTAETFDRLDSLSRLDARLWGQWSALHRPAAHDRLQARSFLRSVARHAYPHGGRVAARCYAPQNIEACVVTSIPYLRR